MATSRAAFRFPVELRGWLHLTDRHSMAARVLNLSRTGAGLWLDEPEPVDRAAEPAPFARLTIGQPVRLAVIDVIGGCPVVRQRLAHVTHAGPRTETGGQRVGLIFQVGWQADAAVAAHRESAELAWPLALLAGVDPARDDRRSAAAVASSAALVAIVGLVTDQVTKAAVWTWAVLAGVSLPTSLPLIPGLLALVPVTNSGAVGGIAGNLPFTAQLCALGALTVAACALGWGSRQPAPGSAASRAAALASGLITAGLLGNAMDRLALGFVRDFLACGLLPNCIFNLADVELVLGAIVALATQLARSHDGTVD